MAQYWCEKGVLSTVYVRADYYRVFSDDNGVPHVFMMSGSQNGRLHHWWRTGAGWQYNVITGSSNTRGDMAVDHNTGYAYAIHPDFFSANLIHSVWTGSGWSPTTILTPGSGNILAALIAVDDNGKSHVLYAWDITGTWHYMENTAGSWSSPADTSITYTNVLEHDGATLAVNGAGTFVVVAGGNTVGGSWGLVSPKSWDNSAGANWTSTAQTLSSGQPEGAVMVAARNKTSPTEIEIHCTVWDTDHFDIVEYYSTNGTWSTTTQYNGSTTEMIPWNDHGFAGGWYHQAADGSKVIVLEPAGGYPASAAVIYTADGSGWSAGEAIDYTELGTEVETSISAIHQDNNFDEYDILYVQYDSGVPDYDLVAIGMSTSVVSRCGPGAAAFTPQIHYI